MASVYGKFIFYVKKIIIFLKDELYSLLNENFYLDGRLNKIHLNFLSKHKYKQECYTNLLCDFLFEGCK